MGSEKQEAAATKDQEGHSSRQKAVSKIGGRSFGEPRMEYSTHRVRTHKACEPCLEVDLVKDLDLVERNFGVHRIARDR